MTTSCRRVKLHIPKPPKPEFNILFERRGTPVECTLRLEEPPVFCTLTKNSTILVQVPCKDVISPLKITDNTLKLTNYVTITFLNNRYTLLFKSLVESNTDYIPLEDNTASADDEHYSDSTYDSTSPISRNMLSVSPAYANRNFEITDEILCDNVPIFISGTFESNSTIYFNEIRDREDKHFVIVKIEWKLSNSIRDTENFGQVVSTSTSLKLNDLMIGKFIQLSICWSEQKQYEDSTIDTVYKQSVIKGPILPNQNLVRDIMIHSLTDTVVFNTMLSNENNKCNYSPAILIFTKNIIHIKQDTKENPITLNIHRVKISMNNLTISLSEDVDKIINLHMSDTDITVLLFNVIIFRKYREKYATLAKWERDLSVGLYSDFNRIYRKILKSEHFLM